MYYDRPMTKLADKVSILDGAEGPELDLVEGEGEARAIVWPGVGAQARSLHRVWLKPGARMVEQRHPGEAAYYVIAGGGWVVDAADAERQSLRQGSMFHVDDGTAYSAQAGDEGMELIGGPSPADPALYEDLS